MTPAGLKSLVVVSNELMKDSDPSALEVVGAGLVRDLQRKLDAAYFGDTVANGPNGIEHLTANQVTDSAFDGTLDVFAEAISLAEQVGVTALAPDGTPGMAFCGHPSDVLRIATTKSGTDFNTPLLGPDASQATARSVLGVPLRSSPAVTPGGIWLVPKAKAFVVIRQQAEVVSDSSFAFSSGRTGIRCVVRVGVAFPHEEAVVLAVMDEAS